MLSEEGPRGRGEGRVSRSSSKTTPNAKDLVAQARKHLPSELKLLPAPWVVGERLQINMKLPTGLDIGTMIYMVDAAKHDGKDVTRCSTRGLVTVSDASSYSEVLCETESFKPITSSGSTRCWARPTPSTATTSVEITVVGKDEPFTIDFTPPAFDNEQGVELFRRLPLAVGYKTTITIIPIAGRQPRSSCGVNVPAKERSPFLPARSSATSSCSACRPDVLDLDRRTSLPGAVCRRRRDGRPGEDRAGRTRQAGNGQRRRFFAHAAGRLAVVRAGKQFKKDEGDAVSSCSIRVRMRTSQVDVRPKQTLEGERTRIDQGLDANRSSTDIKKVYTDFKVREPGLSDNDRRRPPGDGDRRRLHRRRQENER